MPSKPSPVADFFPGEGAMVRAVRDKDWTRTLLGPVPAWPQSLRSAVGICLNSHFPMAVLCGPQLVYIYNDAAIPIFGDKHPRALGQPVAEVWPEAWPTIGPMLHSVLMTGVATRHDDLPLLLERRGFAEECYFTFSCSPVRGEGDGICGVFVAVLETTGLVLHERQCIVAMAGSGHSGSHFFSDASQDKQEPATPEAQRTTSEQALRITHAELERRVALRMRELRETSKLLFAVFDRAPGGIAITDTEGRFIRANAAYQNLVGYTEEELRARSMQSLTDPQDYPRKSALLEQLLRGERESFEMEMRYLRPDGTVLWVNNFVSTIDDEQHRPCYFVKITQDITDRKRAEREILASQGELRTLYDRLQTVREEEKRALAREVHDQLGQVLSAAKIDIKLLEDDIHLHGAPLSRRKISAELRSACLTLDRAIQLVGQIATELRAPELDERGLYAAIAWHVRDFERRTRITCSIALAGNVREPTGAVATALFRIFLEAMTNILRHAKARHVWISLVRRGSAVVLRVRDDGVGISRKQSYGIRAIGLAGMRERAALAGGRLAVGPLRPCGTLVSARIPLAGTGAASGQTGPVTPESSGENA